VHIKCYSFPLVFEIEESDEEVLSKLEKVPKQVAKLSHDTKIITATETKLGKMISSVFLSQMAKATKAGQFEYPEQGKIGGS
jgi:DNA-directed RNA polymerase subunit H (RpoH/RPB5)